MQAACTPILIPEGLTANNFDVLRARRAPYKRYGPFAFTLASNASGGFRGETQPSWLNLLTAFFAVFAASEAENFAQSHCLESKTAQFPEPLTHEVRRTITTFWPRRR